MFVGLLLYRLRHGRRAVRLGAAHNGGCAAPVSQVEEGETPVREQSAHRANIRKLVLMSVLVLLAARLLTCSLTSTPNTFPARHEVAGPQARCQCCHRRFCHRRSIHCLSVQHQQYHRHPLPFSGMKLAVYPYSHSGGFCGGFGQHTGRQRQSVLCGWPGHRRHCSHGHLQLIFSKRDRTTMQLYVLLIGTLLTSFFRQHPVNALTRVMDPNRIRHPARNAGRQLQQCQL